jgi:hypothetical protein
MGVLQSSGSTITKFGQKRWVYVSTHLSTEISVSANFFTDGQKLGFQLGDQLVAVGSTTYIITSHQVIAVGATTTDVSSAVTIGLGP